MSHDFSFKYYVENYNNNEIYNFNKYFKEKIITLPNKTISSKKLMEVLSVNSDMEKLVFRSVFLKYFKEKLYNNLM